MSIIGIFSRKRRAVLLHFFFQPWPSGVTEPKEIRGPFFCYKWCFAKQKCCIVMLDRRVFFFPLPRFAIFIFLLSPKEEPKKKQNHITGQWQSNRKRVAFGNIFQRASYVLLLKIHPPDAKLRQREREGERGPREKALAEC